jgi:hypothetical protein
MNSPPRYGESRGHHSPAPLKESSSHTTLAHEYIAELHRRRNAKQRVPPWRDACPCRDPWTCWCDESTEPSDRLVDAYEAAAESLLCAGMTPAPFLPEMRVMWRKGLRSRELVRDITSRWQVAA